MPTSDHSGLWPAALLSGLLGVGVVGVARDVPTPMVLAIYFSACAVGLSLLGRPKWVLTLTLFFFHLFFVTSGILQSAHREYPLPAYQYTGDELATASWLLLLGAASFLITYQVTWSRRSRRVDRPPELHLDTSRRDAKLCAVLVVLVAATVVWTFVRGGGLGVFLSSRTEFTQAIVGENRSLGDPRLFEEEALNAFQSFNLRVVRLVPYVATVVVLSCTSSTRRQRIIATVGGLLILNPVVAPRFLFGAFALSVAYIFARRSGSERWRTGSRYSLCLALIAMTFSFGSFASSRSVGSEFRFSLQSTDEIVSNNDFAQYQQAVNAVVFTKENGFSLGSQLAGATLNFVPASLWQSKPEPTGRLIRGDLWEGNPSSPLPVEGYVNFGLVGLILFMGIAGLAGARLDLASPRSWRGLAVTAALIGNWVLLMRGSLTTWMTNMEIGFGIYVAAALAARFLSLARSLTLSSASFARDGNQDSFV